MIVVLFFVGLAFVTFGAMEAFFQIRKSLRRAAYGG